MIELVLVENQVNPFKDKMNEEMIKPIKHFEKELVKIRTGRAHSSMVEDIPVSCYAQPAVPLKNFAAITAPETRLIIIQPWDPAIINDIEKALLASDAGVSPENDGKIIRITLPIMSSARREDLIKTLGKKAEECRVTIRNIRKDFNNLIRDAKKDKKISENFFNRLEDVLQEVTDSFIKQTDTLADKKAQDIKTV